MMEDMDQTGKQIGDRFQIGRRLTVLMLVKLAVHVAEEEKKKGEEDRKKGGGEEEGGGGG